MGGDLIDPRERNEERAWQSKGADKEGIQAKSSQNQLKNPQHRRTVGAKLDLVNVPSMCSNKLVIELEVACKTFLLIVLPVLSTSPLTCLVTILVRETGIRAST